MLLLLVSVRREGRAIAVQLQGGIAFVHQLEGGDALHYLVAGNDVDMPQSERRMKGHALDPATAEDAGPFGNAAER